MPAKPRRAAIYARISTDETRQNPETQLMQLREYATNLLCDLEQPFLYQTALGLIGSIV